MTAASFDHLRVLIVEDNHHMRALLRSLMNAIGIRQVIECNDGAAAYIELREKKPDFVLTDLSMKPIDGIEFTRMVRTAKDSPNPYVPIIMVTGHTERARVEAARDAGVTEFLAKPITVQNLLLRIAEIVERPRPFVRCPAYFGPDRRRRKDEDYAGPWRRQDDIADDLAIV
ncbi:MAG: response regulator [Pseudomonadota bacterium]|nr:response regulator [Pseudomonadota bacterium]